MDEPKQRLPHAEQAMIEERKIVDYLLNPSHPQGQAKARFFERLGFDRERPEHLRAALSQLAVTSKVVERESPYGRKFIGVGTIRSPSGRSARVTTVWIMLGGLPPPILVTAYPSR